MSATDEQMERYLQTCRDLIEEHGLMIQMVATRPFSFSYTVGLTPHLGYELLTVGLPQDVAGGFLNSLATRLREQEIADDVLIEELANMPLKLRTQSVVDPVTGVDVSEALALSYRLGYAPTKFRQLLWPDPKGRFPGEPGYHFMCSQNVADVIGPEETKH